VVLALAVTVANAGPTVSAHNALHATATIHSSDASQAVCYGDEGLLEEKDSRLANLAYDLLPPSAAALTTATATTSPVEALPAVPAAVFMGVVGFICVSFVKDRRLWLAALTGLLWAGQTGLQALPGLVLRLTQQNHNSHLQTAGRTAHRYYFEHPSRLRSDLEDTEYIGLLHRLAAIPNLTVSSLQPRLSLLQKQEPTIREPQTLNKTSQSAIIYYLSRPVELFNCPASRAGQFISFSPAFIFENLPRGPPDCK